MNVQRICRKKKKKRKRIRRQKSDSSEDSDGNPKSKGRKNIRKVMRNKDLDQETKDAARIEMERKKRIQERQKLVRFCGATTQSDI